MIDGLLDRLETARDQLVDLGIAFAQLLFVLALAVVISRWLRRRLRRRLSSAPSPVMAVVIENSAAIGVYVVAITIVLGLWGLTWSGLLTALSIGTVAAAFGFQDFLRSLVGGILVLIERPFAPGDRIKIRDVEGRVEQIDLRTTVIRADNGDRIAVPNALMFSDPVINRSPNRVIRVLTVSGLEGPPAELRQRAHDALATVPGFDGAPRIMVRTRKERKLRQALDAFPGVERDKEDVNGEVKGIGLRIVASGERNPAALEEAKRRLQDAFPGARISS